MAAPRAPLFLERQSYRRRRLMDAARILPVAGLVALLLPVLWSGADRTSTASEALYMFGLWLVLILAALALSRPLRAAIDREGAVPGSTPGTASPPPGTPDAAAGAATPADSPPPRHARSAVRDRPPGPAGTRRMTRGGGPCR